MFIVAIIYSLVITGQWEEPFSYLILSHAALVTLISILFFLLFRNIYYFAIPKISIKVIKWCALIFIGVIYISLLLSCEHFLYHYYFIEQYPAFLDTFFIRALIFTLFYSIIALYYSFQIILNQIDKSATEIIEEEIRQEMSNVGSDSIMERISIITNKGIKVIDIAEIISLRANGDYVLITTSEGTWLKEQTMKYFETSLPPKDFVRIHRSHIVNITYISRIERNGDKKLLLLKNGDHIPISATGDKALRIKLNL